MLFWPTLFKIMLITFLFFLAYGAYYDIRQYKPSHTILSRALYFLMLTVSVILIIITLLWRPL